MRYLLSGGIILPTPLQSVFSVCPPWRHPAGPIWPHAVLSSLVLKGKESLPSPVIPAFLPTLPPFSLLPLPFLLFFLLFSQAGQTFLLFFLRNTETKPVIRRCCFFSKRRLPWFDPKCLIKDNRCVCVCVWVCVYVCVCESVCDWMCLCVWTILSSDFQPHLFGH